MAAEQHDALAPPPSRPLPSSAASLFHPAAPKKGRIHHQSVTNVFALNAFIKANGDVNAPVAGGLSWLGFVVCIGGLIWMAVSVRYGLFPYSIAVFGVIVAICTFSLLFAWRMLYDIYLCWVLEWRPLHMAAYKRRTDVVEILIRAGADVHLASRFGKLPVDLALSYLAEDEAIIMLTPAGMGPLV
jgi:hypothetical protein